MKYKIVTVQEYIYNFFGVRKDWAPEKVLALTLIFVLVMDTESSVHLILYMWHWFFIYSPYFMVLAFFICFAHDWWGRGYGKPCLWADWGPCMYWKPRGGVKFSIINLTPFLTVWLNILPITLRCLLAYWITSLWECVVLMSEGPFVFVLQNQF